MRWIARRKPELTAKPLQRGQKAIARLEFDLTGNSELRIWQFNNKTPSRPLLHLLVCDGPSETDDCSEPWRKSIRPPILWSILTAPEAHTRLMD